MKRGVLLLYLLRILPDKELNSRWVRHIPETQKPFCHQQVHSSTTRASQSKG